MNKIIKALSVCAVIGIMAAASVCLSGCEEVEADSCEGLVAIKADYSYGIKFVIMYDYRTGVMYATNSNGGITPLYNPDGSLRIYTEG